MSISYKKYTAIVNQLTFSCREYNFQNQQNGIRYPSITSIFKYFMFLGIQCIFYRLAL